MSRMEGKIMVDARWVAAIVFTAFVGIFAKDVYGIPSRILKLEVHSEQTRHDIQRMEKKVSEININIAEIAKVANYCRIIQKGEINE